MMQLKKVALYFILFFAATQITYADYETDIDGSVRDGIYYSHDHLLHMKVPAYTVGIADKNYFLIFGYRRQEIEFRVVPPNANRYFENPGFYTQNYIIKYFRQSSNTYFYDSDQVKKTLLDYPFVRFKSPHLLSKTKLTIHGHPATQWVFLENAHYGEKSNGLFAPNTPLMAPTLYIHTLIDFETYFVSVEYFLTTYTMHPNMATIFKNYNNVVNSIKIAGE